jgi:hypothetical protein
MPGSVACAKSLACVQLGKHILAHVRNMTMKSLDHEGLDKAYAGVQQAHLLCSSRCCCVPWPCKCYRQHTNCKRGACDDMVGLQHLLVAISSCGRTCAPPAGTAVADCLRRRLLVAAAAGPVAAGAAGVAAQHSNTPVLSSSQCCRWSAVQ